MAPLPPEKVTDFIGRLLEEKDPATVGLRRILKQKQDTGKDYPLQNAQLKEFKVPGKNAAVFDADQRRVIELEKELLDLRKQVQERQLANAAAVKKAYDDGFKKGSAEGEMQGIGKAKTDADIEIQKIQKQVGDFLKALEDSKKRIYGNAEQVLLKFCMQIVEKILCTEVTQNRDAVLSVIKKSLSYIADREKMVIRISPADFEHVANQKAFWAPVNERLTDIAIEPDDRIPAGGCIIDSNSGVVDARLGVQLAELSELIEKVWESVNASHSNPAADQSAAG